MIPHKRHATFTMPFPGRIIAVYITIAQLSATQHNSSMNRLYRILSTHTRRDATLVFMICKSKQSQMLTFTNKLDQQCNKRV